MRVLCPFACWAAVRQVVRSEKIDFRGVIEKVVAGIDAGMKMGVDEAGRDKASSRVDFLVHGIAVLFAGEFNSISLEYDDAVLENLVFRAVKAYDKSALN